MKPGAAIAKAKDSGPAEFPPAVPGPMRRDLLLTMNRVTGGLSALVPDDNFDLLLDDRLINVGIVNVGRLRIEHVNRIADPLLGGDPLPWRTGGADGSAIRKNVAPPWTLAGGNTAFVRSAAGPGETPVAIAYCCPSEGTGLSIRPGATYTFQALFGLHRAAGSIRFTFRTESGETAGVFEAEVNQKALGGPRLADYAHRHLTAAAPDDAATLTVEIVKSVTASGEEDSYLFFTHPALTQSERIDFDALHHDLPEGFLSGLFLMEKPELFQADIPLPEQAMDGGRHTVTLRHRTTGQSASIPVFLPATVSVTGHNFRLEGSSLTGNLASAHPVSVALWADGRPTGVTAASEPGTGIIRLPLPMDLCDGRPHIFEARRALTGQLIAQHACMGPCSLTPWDALQKYSGMPLPSQLSPLAAYRQTSLAAGLSGAHGVPLNELHDILLEGFDRPRREFRVLPFPHAADPDVSIVIPVHNKFDVTYNCLAAILFAASRASFEVIVVDDGSSDTTLDLPAIAPGIVLVRNDKPLGFAGACNAGAAKARGRYIFFLNNDTEPTAFFLDELIFAFENFGDVGLAGSRLIYPDGRQQEAGGIVWGSGDPWNYGRGANPFDPRYSYARVCDYISGAAIMIPRKLWNEVGGFSPEFMPAYFEDTDLAFKVKHAGRKVVYVPHSVVVHYEGMSNGTDPQQQSGLKRFQDVNRPKFKKKWAPLFSANGKTGENVDLAKDRAISKRVLFLDYDVPHLDRDAGSYAAVQEIRLFQAMGCKVTFAPLNMAYLGRHTEFLQRLGVEAVFMPFAPDLSGFIRSRGREFDLIYITRYNVAEQVMGLLREHAPQAKLVVNVADLHFLREIRDAISTASPEKMAQAVKTREAEIAAIGKADLILSYSTVEQAVITSHITHGPKTGIVPWVIDAVPLRKPFAGRKDIAFIGGYAHPPNAAAVKFFATQVMPLLRARLPGIRFLVYGSNVPADIEALAADDIVIKGYIADVSEMLDNCRVFAAPLLTGAGMKGKVLDCLSAGIPAVLSPIAAEGIGLSDGVDSLIARNPREWVDAVARLYEDEKAWNAMSKAAHEVARRIYSFEAGVAAMKEALASIEFFSNGAPAICANSARPVSPRHLHRAASAAYVKSR